MLQEIGSFFFVTGDRIRSLENRLESKCLSLARISMKVSRERLWLSTCCHMLLFLSCSPPPSHACLHRRVNEQLRTLCVLYTSERVSARLACTRCAGRGKRVRSQVDNLLGCAHTRRVNDTRRNIIGAWERVGQGACANSAVAPRRCNAGAGVWQSESV